jgi:nucleoside phosphorylase
VSQVDVLLLTALREEFDAARTLGLATTPGGPGVAEWDHQDPDGSTPFLWGEYRTVDGHRFSVALARPTEMGGRAMGPFAAALTEQLRPSCLAMSGVCGGNPAHVALGDVVVAEPVYEWDEGKLSRAGFEGDHRQLRLDPRWLRTAQDFDASGLASYGAASDEEALLWLLERLHLGQEPRDHPARRSYFPRGTWRGRLVRFKDDGLISRGSDGGAELTSGGRARVQRRLYDDVDGPQQLPFRVLVAPMASGSAVVGDPEIWMRLKSMGMRKIAAVEMEAATIATVARDRQVPFWLVIKGVMDHADTGKDDRYKQFAARASADVLFALLGGLVGAAPVDLHHETRRTQAHRPEPMTTPYSTVDLAPAAKPAEAPLAQPSDDQRRVIRVIYGYFREHNKWPMLAHIDRPLRWQGIDVVAATRTMPGDLLPANLGNVDPGPDDSMVLTLAAMALCDEARQDIELFLTMVRWAARVEEDFNPIEGPSSQPRITSNDLTQQLGLSDDLDAVKRLYEMIKVQPWGFGSGGGQPSDWWYEVRREIQRFAQVESTSDHVRARQAWVSESVAPSPTGIRTPHEQSRFATPSPVNTASLLDNLEASDPVPDVSDRTNGRLYLVANPVDAPIDALAAISTTSAVKHLDAAVRQALDVRGGPPFSPDLGSGTWRRRGSGMVNERGVREDGSVREDSLLLLKVAESGSVTLLCGRATSLARAQWRRAGSSEEPTVYRVIIPNLVLGLVHSALSLAADLANRYAGYHGGWAVGLRLTGLSGAIAYEYVQSGDEDVVQPYDDDIYQRTVVAETEELLERPAAVTERLVAALLRGIAVDRRYLPYSATEADPTGRA